MCGELADFRDRALGLRRTHAAGRLVEQQQSRLGDQRHSDLEQRHVAVGQRPREPPGKRRHADLLQRPLDALACVHVARRRAERVQEPLARLPRDPEIVRDAELVEYALDLQRALDAEPADLDAACRPVMSRPSKNTRPLSAGSRPEIRLKNVVLPAPFGPMMACSCPPGSDEAEIVDRRQTAESLRQMLGAQDRLAHGSVRGSVRGTV